MTYKITQTTALDVRLIELSHSSAQTVSSGSTVAFDTLTASDAGHGVNLSNGVISLDTSRRYWIQASMHVDRASTTSSWEFAFFDDTLNTEILGKQMADIELDGRGMTDTRHMAHRRLRSPPPMCRPQHLWVPSLYGRCSLRHNSTVRTDTR